MDELGIVPECVYCTLQGVRQLASDKHIWSKGDDIQCNYSQMFSMHKHHPQLLTVQSTANNTEETDNKEEIDWRGKKKSWEGIC